MENSPILGLPYIAAGQAQKHITHNEAIRSLDAIVQLAVLDRDTVNPPASPNEGDRYIVAALATGAWAGKDNQIAAFQNSGWMFYAPLEGWLSWVTNENQLYVFSGTAWAKVSDSDLQNIPKLGINATADATTRLSINSPTALFNHEGNGHQVKINKNATTDTGSVLFQTNWSGRAEFGTTGDDDWHVKTSADGAVWNEALIADKNTGAVRFPAGQEHALSRQRMTSLIHTPGGVGENSIWRFDLARSGIPRQATISSVLGDVITLTTAVANQFFTNSQMENVSYVRIWNMSKSPEQSAWVKRVNNPGTDTELQVLNAGDISSWANGETVQLGEPASQIPSNVVAVDISPMMQNMLGAVFPQAGLLVKAGISLNGVAGNMGVTPTGAGGSFSNLFGHSNGSLLTGQITIPCTQLSPISNSNLIFIREVDGGADSLLVSIVSVFGIWV